MTSTTMHQSLCRSLSGATWNMLWTGGHNYSTTTHNYRQKQAYTHKHHTTYMYLPTTQHLTSTTMHQSHSKEPFRCDMEHVADGGPQQFNSYHSYHAVTDVHTTVQITTTTTNQPQTVQTSITKTKNTKNVNYNVNKDRCTHPDVGVPAGTGTQPTVIMAS